MGNRIFAFGLGGIGSAAVGQLADVADAAKTKH
jgi:hypothetical protein